LLGEVADQLQNVVVVLGDHLEDVVETLRGVAVKIVP